MYVPDPCDLIEKEMAREDAEEFKRYWGGHTRNDEYDEPEDFEA